MAQKRDEWEPGPNPVTVRFFHGANKVGQFRRPAGQAALYVLDIGSRRPFGKKWYKLVKKTDKQSSIRVQVVPTQSPVEEKCQS